MKKLNYILFIVFLIGQVFPVSIVAQDKKEDSRIERLKSQKVAFLTERIGLSSEEAQEFWPVYNEMSAKMDKLWKGKMNEIDKLYGPGNDLSPEEKVETVDRYINYEIERARLEKQYHEKFKKILSIDQVIKLYGAEHEFKERMLHLLNKGRGRESSCEGCDKLVLEELAKT